MGVVHWLHIALKLKCGIVQTALWTLLHLTTIENDEAFLESIASCTLCFESSNAVDVSSANELELNLFPVDFRSRSLLNNDDIDPDLNYFNDIAYGSTYLTPYALEQKMSMPAASFAIYAYQL